MYECFQNVCFTDVQKMGQIIFFQIMVCFWAPKKYTVASIAPSYTHSLRMTLFKDTHSLETEVQLYVNHFFCIFRGFSFFFSQPKQQHMATIFLAYIYTKWYLWGKVVLVCDMKW